MLRWRLRMTTTRLCRTHRLMLAVMMMVVVVVLRAFPPLRPVTVMARVREATATPPLLRAWPLALALGLTAALIIMLMAHGILFRTVGTLCGPNACIHSPTSHRARAGM